MKKVPGGLTPTFGTLLKRSPQSQKSCRNVGIFVFAMRRSPDRARLNTLLPIPRFHLVGANPLHPAMQQKTARRRFHSQKYGWASRIRTYITGTKNQGPAIGRWPSVCHKAFCDYNVSGMVKPNKQPIRQNATTQYEHRHATYRERRTYRALSSQNATALAAATLRESTPCAIGIFTV